MHPRTNWNRVKACFTPLRSRNLCTSSEPVSDTTTRPKPARAKPPEAPAQPKASTRRVLQYFADTPEAKPLQPYVPQKYFVPARRLSLQHLYLVNNQIADDVVSKILPHLKRNDEQVVCETNAGLGLISHRLLDDGVKLVRLYETCPDFRKTLKDLGNCYPNRIELFVKDIYSLGLLSALDKRDGGDRVGEMLKGLPKRANWSDDPVMTIVGPMPNLSFVNYLLKMLALQHEVVSCGRVQMFALMKPRDYIMCTSGPGRSLHSYQVSSVLFQLFFDSELMEKYPRKAFLPWESQRVTARTKQLFADDVDFIYLARINLKTQLPIEAQHLLHLYYFIKQGFKRGRAKVIPVLERWLPDIGADLIVPRDKRRSRCFQNMGVFTEFGDLNPNQILEIFLEMLEHPGYTNSPFMALVEAQLLKTETTETYMSTQSGASRHNVHKLQE